MSTERVNREKGVREVPPTKQKAKEKGRRKRRGKNGARPQRELRLDPDHHHTRRHAHGDPKEPRATQERQQQPVVQRHGQQLSQLRLGMSSLGIWVDG
jgi:hypothetical protein